MEEVFKPKVFRDDAAIINIAQQQDGQWMVSYTFGDQLCGRAFPTLDLAFAYSERVLERIETYTEKELELQNLYADTFLELQN